MCTVVALETTYRAMSTNRYIANVLNIAEHAANVEMFLSLCHGSQQHLFKVYYNMVLIFVVFCFIILAIMMFDHHFQQKRSQMGQESKQ